MGELHGRTREECDRNAGRVRPQRARDLVGLRGAIERRPDQEAAHARRFCLATDFRRFNARRARSEEHTSELQSLAYLVCRLLLEKKKKQRGTQIFLLRNVMKMLIVS